jgi:hypothetical protein
MIKHITFLLLAGVALPLSASVPVPENLPNPFEIPDPTGFRVNAKGGGSGSVERSAAEAARGAAFDKIKDKLFSLPVRGIISDMNRGTGKGNTTVLLGSYTLRKGSELPPSDFEIKGIIKVASVSSDKIVIKVSIELETKEITIPLAR